MPMYPALEETMDQLETLYDRESDIVGIATGFHDLDSILLGLQPSTLSIVAARPGQGKTSFALGLAQHVALHGRKPVLFFSMEMGYLELTKRLLAAEARVPSRKLQTGRLSRARVATREPGRRPARRSAVLHRRQPALHGDGDARQGAPHQGALRRPRADRRRLPAADVVGPQAVESRQVEVSELSRGLKILARELEAPVVTLSQLNRQLEYRQDKRPMLADLRESGCLTADTDDHARRRNDRDDRRAATTAAQRDVEVLTLDEHLQLVPGTMTRVFPSGVKKMFELAARVGPPGHREREPPVPHARRLGAPRRSRASAGSLRRHGAAGRRSIRSATRSRARCGTTSSARACSSTAACARTTSSSAWAQSEAVRTASTRQGVSRALMRRIADALPDVFLTDLSTSDVLWDEIVAIEPRGEAPVFDATVPGTHNFVANDIVVHNSIEQDADVVMFIYRDEYYNPESDQRGLAEIIVAKHRNGPDAARTQARSSTATTRRSRTAADAYVASSDVGVDLASVEHCGAAAVDDHAVLEVEAQRLGEHDGFEIATAPFEPFGIVAV